MKERNAREIYNSYIEMMNEDNKEKRELVIYQDYGESFAIMRLSYKVDNNEYNDFQLYRINYFGDVDILRTYSYFTEALTAFLALIYNHKPIISLPF